MNRTKDLERRGYDIIEIILHHLPRGLKIKGKTCHNVLPRITTRHLRNTSARHYCCHYLLVKWNTHPELHKCLTN
jgi:hypothetical protein